MILGLVENGVIANHSVNCPNVIRFTPPAVIGETELVRIEVAVRNGFRTLTTNTSLSADT